jgi:hypothetical protein
MKSIVIFCSTWIFKLLILYLLSFKEITLYKSNIKSYQLLLIKVFEISTTSILNFHN